MGLSGSDTALMYSQFGVMRFGASRFGYTSPRVAVSVGGVQRAWGKSAAYNFRGLTVTETRSSTPNKASFEVIGNAWVPTVGMEVIVTMGSTNRLRRLYGGTILSVVETNIAQTRRFTVECVDWNWVMDGAPVYGHFTGTADAIARELISTYAPTDFTVRQVESGLATVSGGITFTGVKLSVALHRLAKRASVPGAIVTQFVDYSKDLYFRVTPSTVLTNPTALVVDLATLKTFNVSRDLSQVANRVPFEGGGSAALTEVAVGETILPLTDAPSWWYGDVGGVVISGPQKITYTTRVEGGGGSVVGPGVAPTNAPTAALASGSGVDSGSHVITFVWKTASGRTTPGAQTTITVGLVSAPSTAVTAGAPSSGAGLDGGTHTYYPVFRTAAGNTTAGPASNIVTATAAQAAPTDSGFAIVLYAPGQSGAYDPGATYHWKYTFIRNSDGAETSPSGASGGQGADGTYNFAVQESLLQSIPSGYSRRWYRTDGGGSSYKRTTDPIWDGGSYWVFGIESDESLGAAAPSTNGTEKGVCAVTGIPVYSSALVTYVDMYREFNSAGASTAKLAFSVTNGTTSASDSTTNAGLGATVPSSNTAAANQIAVSGIAIGPTGTTDREIYMSPAGGGARKLALTISNNTATTGTITISDASLASAAAEPASDTSGLTQPSGTVLPGATSAEVAGTAPFLSGGGWAYTGSQQFRYTGFSGASLTGIPASGAGAITQPIPYNTTIAAAPCLTGIPASGDGSILYAILKGDDVNCFVTVEDTDAQSALQALLDADDPVVRECPPLQDRRLGRDEALTRANAFLSLRAYPGVRVGPYKSKDMNNRAGLLVDINITAPEVVNDTFQIQSVSIGNFSGNAPPDYLVMASDELFSIEDLLSGES